MPSGQRLITFDLLRGYFLFVIIIDHLARYPGIFEIFTGKGWLWTSAAEGFFFISGMMLGLIRGRKEKDLDFKTVCTKILKRAFLLYFITVGLTLLFSFTATFYLGNPDLKAGSMPMFPITSFIQDAITFQYIYGWQDFLKYYTIFLFFSPISIFLLRKDMWYLVLLISASVWFFFRTDYFSCAWQILFFTGMIVGYKFYDIKIYYHRLSKVLRVILNSFILILALITLVTSTLVVHFSDWIRGSFYWNILESLNLSTNNLFDKSSLPITRLLIFYLWFAALYILFTKFEKEINKYFGRFLLTLGRSSLFTYVIHSFFVFFAYLYIPNHGDFLSNVFITSLILFSIYCIVKNKNFFNNFWEFIKYTFLPNINRINWHYTYMNIIEIKNNRIQK